ncbi:hypothetical protein HU200_016109 [Digitaria exilis]|uniref:F-box protein n=1 Tax=Digitaria exilis TaxID=1010633 RepID=A0A835F8W5_9POAL|nr:hypothetical protein HU200_016109 [Digitaria exilis]
MYHRDCLSSLPDEVLVTILHRGETPLRKLSLVFSGSDECTDAVNSAIASAVEKGVKHIDVAVVDHTKYEFPSCFKGFSALTKLVLVAMHMSLKDTQLLLRNCKSLKSLYLIDMFDIRFIQLPKLEELVWLWSVPCGLFKIDTPALQRLEYCGELLPASTFQSLPCLEHVSLQYVRYLSFLESRNGVVWDGTNFQHNSLKEVEMYNFKGRDNEIGFARLILRRAPNLKRIAFSQARLYEAEDHQCIPPGWPGAEEFCARDNQSVLSKLLDAISSGARVSFMQFMRYIGLHFATHTHPDAIWHGM